MSPDRWALFAAAILACWLAAFLLARRSGGRAPTLAGLGLLSHAFGLGALIAAGMGLGHEASFARLWSSLRFLPAIAWSASLLALIPEIESTRRSWPGSWPMLAGLLAGLALALPDSTLLPWLVSAFLLASAARLLAHRRLGGMDLPSGLVLAATIFFGLGSLPLFWNWQADHWLGLSQSVVAVALAGDLLILGLAIAFLDAFEQGEAIRYEMLRSGLASLLLGVVLGGQVLLAMWVEGEASSGLVLLLAAVLVSSIGLANAADRLASLLDRITFAGRPERKDERATLRELEVAVAKRAADEPSQVYLDPTEMDADRFGRLTRRALGQMGNLGRLASSPLATMPAVSERLVARGARNDSLDRAAELRAILAESIQRLKPEEATGFSSGEAWRHYNVLYYPYVAGLRPFSRRVEIKALAPELQPALAWFQREVPERTLYNWQRAAAALVAQDLLDLHRRPSET